MSALGLLLVASWGYSLAVALRLLTAVTSVAEHRPQGAGSVVGGRWCTT